MATDLMNLVEATQLRDDIPAFAPGDSISVHVRVIEGEKERIQKFDGVVISIRCSGSSKTFMVRKVSNVFGVERIFPVHSPRVSQIELLLEGCVRRGNFH